MNNEKKCMCCKFFIDRTDNTPGFGSCRRFPPSILGNFDGQGAYYVSPINTRFPEVNRAEWCGEFELKMRESDIDEGPKNDK